MDIQKLFIQYIVENDIENISLMLKNKKTHNLRFVILMLKNP